MYRRYKAAAALTAAVAMTMGITGCGGGGGEDEEDDAPSGPLWTAPPGGPTAPATGATVDGVFRDAVVQGLSYSSGALSGATGAGGGFQYQQGTPITFSVGAVTLGTGTGQVFMSPMNTLTSTTNLSQQIDNRLRFLQLLDIDGNPENGILISEAVRAAAATWTQPDFSLSYTDFATAVAPIGAAASTADGTTHTLPSETIARQHFGRTFWCTFTGLFRGTYSGSGDNGVFAVASYGSGQMFGLAYSNVDREGVRLEKTTQMALSIRPNFVAGITSNGGSFTGEFATVDTMSGNWTSGPDTGTFSGARSGGSASAVYRIAGYQFPLGTALIMQFDLDASNQVTGSVIDLDGASNGVPVALTGSLSGTTLTATAASNRYTVSGSFNPNALPTNRRLTGTMTDSAKNRTFPLDLAGCRLN